ncbi:MAG: Nif3-like dinuclear metal center hexameric protein [Candidatus Woesearchaeota archaeon]
MKLAPFVRFLNQQLKIHAFNDDSRNGLQVNCGKEITKIAFAVDACLESFKKAAKLHCDLIIVHHGLLWKHQKFKDLTLKRISFLKKNNLSLYGVHLPLDAHPLYGNNAELCRLLDVKAKKPFGIYHGKPVGFRGTVGRQSLTKFVSLVHNKLNTKPFILPFGSRQISKVGIVSGGGRAALEEATKLKLDCFLTGEITHSDYHRAKESSVNVVVAGHYKTETLGVKALARLLHQKFNIQTVFIDSPTGM